MCWARAGPWHLEGSRQLLPALLQKCPNLWNTAMPGKGRQGQTSYRGAPWGQLARKSQRASPEAEREPLSFSWQEHSWERTGAAEQSSVPAACPERDATTPTQTSPPALAAAALCLRPRVPGPHAPPPCYGAIISSYPRALMNWLCSNCWDCFFFKEGACSQSSSPARRGCTHPLHSIPRVQERESCVGFSWEIRVRAHSSSVPSPARRFLWFPSPTEDNGFCCSYSPWEAGPWGYTPNTAGLFFCLGYYFTVEVRILGLFCCWVFFKLSPLLHTSFFWHRTATHQLFTIPSPFLFFSTMLPRHRLKGHFLPCRRLPMPSEYI